MTLRDELYKISEEALKQPNETKDPERQEKVSKYLTKKLKKAAATGEKSCTIQLGVLINDMYSLSLKDVIEFASENGLDCAYPRMMNITVATLSWNKK